MEDNPTLYPKEDLDPEVEEALKEFRETAKEAFDENFDDIMKILTSLRTETTDTAAKIYYAMQISFIFGGFWTLGELIEAKEEDDNGN